MAKVIAGGTSQDVNVIFTFVDGPMEGVSFEGPADVSNEAGSLYSVTQNGTVGTQFTTISMAGRQAFEEWQSADPTEIGGPYEYYVYRGVDCHGDDATVHVRAAFVDRAPFGVHDPGVLGG